jgi:hypothetical protein
VWGRELAERLGEHLGRAPVFTGQEQPTALLADAARCHTLFGPPHMSLDEMIVQVARWVRAGGRSLGKPTRFSVRDGAY